MEKKKPDWEKIRAEYIGGGTSYRKLAEKHNVSFTTLKERAKREKWGDSRQETRHKADTKLIQKIAEKNDENVVIAADIKRELLLKLKCAVIKFPAGATETQVYGDDEKKIYRLRDLAAVYTELTRDMERKEGAGDTEDLSPLADLLKGGLRGKE